MRSADVHGLGGWSLTHSLSPLLIPKRRFIRSISSVDAIFGAGGATASLPPPSLSRAPPPPDVAAPALFAALLAEAPPPAAPPAPLLLVGGEALVGLSRSMVADGPAACARALRAAFRFWYSDMEVEEEAEEEEAEAAEGFFVLPGRSSTEPATPPAAAVPPVFFAGFS